MLVRDVYPKLRIAMLVIYSKNGVPVRLTFERWQHIMRRHPEMAEQRERVLEILAEPELIHQGDYGELLAIRFYPETPLTSRGSVRCAHDLPVSVRASSLVLHHRP